MARIRQQTDEPSLHCAKATPRRDPHMSSIVSLLSIVLGIVAFVCWIIVLIRMFQAEMTGAAIATLLLVFCGIGHLVGFVLGWMNADRLRVRSTMYLWTGCLIGIFVLSGMLAVLGRAPGVPGL